MDYQEYSLHQQTIRFFGNTVIFHGVVCGMNSRFQNTMPATVFDLCLRPEISAAERKKYEARNYEMLRNG